ncbi:MAG: PIN domain-containing protein [bacterium]|nr:PIN domain-containing protein [bacterium]
MKKRWIIISLFALGFGYLIKGRFNPEFLGLVFAGIFGLLIIGIEILLRRNSTISLLVLSSGLVIGLVIAALSSIFIKETIFSIGLAIGFSYLGLALSYEKRRDFMHWLSEKKGTGLPKMLLDTSAIIDGRILPVMESGFLSGEIILPRFVLKELQNVADSSDSLRRSRGRRGLDLLKKMQNMEPPFEINETHIPEVREVDAKLVFLAKRLNAAIITNDYNLNKVAEIEGVSVLNINELAQAVRPILLPGESFFLQIVKEGKEFGQGVGYLEDGTMVVIEDGGGYLGKKVKVEVGSILQNPAGRMVFTKVAK